MSHAQMLVRASAIDDLADELAQHGLPSLEQKARDLATEIVNAVLASRARDIDAFDLPDLKVA